MKQKKIPQRMCVGCREMKPKRELLRVVKNKEEEISFDPRGKMPGRGAYICVSRACLAKARKTRALERALDTVIPDGVFDLLDGQIESVTLENGGDE